MSLSVPLEPPSKEILHISSHSLVILVKHIYLIQNSIQFNSIQKFTLGPSWGERECSIFLGCDHQSLWSFRLALWTQDVLGTGVDDSSSFPKAPIPATTTTTSTAIVPVALHGYRPRAQQNTNFEWMRRGENCAGWRVERLRLRKTSFKDQRHNGINSKSFHHFSSATWAFERKWV